MGAFAGTVVSVRKTRDFLTETTAIENAMSALDSALAALSVSGSVLLRKHCTASWAMSVGSSAQLAGRVAHAARGRVIAFHMAECGHGDVTLSDGSCIPLIAGDIVILPGGQGHVLSVGGEERADDLDTALAAEAERRRDARDTAMWDWLLPPSPVPDPLVPATTVLSGLFVLDQPDFNPLWDALPTVVCTQLLRRPGGHDFTQAIRLMAAHLDAPAAGSRFLIARLLEAMFAQTVRAFADSAARHETGWFRGLHDPIVARTLAAVHACPGDAWSVARMADAVAMSASRLHTRFIDAMGVSPMQYVVRWRMHLACNRLAATGAPLEHVATQSGYDSVVAFERAFLREVGQAPEAWRRQHAYNPPSPAVTPRRRP